MTWTDTFHINSEWAVVLIFGLCVLLILAFVLIYNYCCRHNTYTSQNNPTLEITRIERRRPRSHSVDSTGNQNIMNVELIHSSVSSRSNTRV